MQKKIAAVLFSTRLTAVLFLVFAAAMAVGTFLDASQETSPTPYTRELIYNAWWFEAIMVLFVVNFLGNIFRFRLYRKEKWATLTLHLAFIFILIGAFVTRYIGYEGVMHIREGATENTMLSEETYLKIFIDGDYMIDGVAQRRNLPLQEVRLSERLDNDFSIETDYNGQPVVLRYKNYIKNAKEGLIETEDGDEYLKIVEAGDGNRHDHWIKVGEVVDIHNILFAVNNPTQGAINITYNEDGSYDISSPFEGSFMRMADQMKGEVVKDSLQPLMLRSLYQLAGMAFVIPDPITKGREGIVKTAKDEPSNMDALVLEISSGGETKTVELLGGKGTAPDPVGVEVGGLKVYTSYGSKQYELPFSITLNDFIADKYPGTEKGYSAFKSKVTVIDSETDMRDEEIYMNHVLDHKGYRFFQASFDPDEKGTILSVNHDRWGTWITYFGYFLLYFGLMAILFDKNTRFGSLKKMLDKVKKKKAALNLLLLLCMSTAGIAQQTETASHSQTSKAQVDSIIKANVVSKEHAAEFAKLIIQDDGRMKPVNTFASELLRKISRKDSYEGLDANQVFISMSEFPRLWVEAPLISLKRGNDSIRKVIGVEEDTERISLLDLFDAKGNYKLEPYLEQATAKANPNQFEKDFIKAHENFYLLNQALSGSILKIFPIPNDENNKWVSFPELSEANFTGMDSTVTRTILPIYFQSVKNSRTTGDYSEPNQLLDGIETFQKKYGSEIMPSEEKIQAEILYNKVDIFNRLYKYFLLFGALMFAFIIVQIFREGKIVNALIKFCKYVIWLFFILMTVGLAARWYISGHAPWSDAYESIIYVAWATVFFGLAFGRKSDLTIASTAFVAAIILWVANQSWLDPSIANLQPVLDSYWLMIHVAVIVASYGPFTLGMILGATTLLLMLLTTKSNKIKMDLTIKELTIITEMALTVGLVMLTIGNFLGGQWANESWGRYWGWDPKETWALISIMIYAFVIHMRLVPGLRGRWFFNVMAIFAYASIMMTYFGVNFYLTGLHSYASGDAPVTPTFVYYLVAFFVVLSAASYFSYKKHYIKEG
ncbi:cytochrome c biogenesis protein CcsA [Candidatus Ulvibacter alkanivorans]|uniref:cytochrome c biogenesis protein CcsA n=1 Tax=Candidatus Ulvibacter alkanivorans TaxID=2267620 RepID=UPI000DF2409B|nr:cytochrome c biogenesis protein CcsA [Candidatus Ulvibacter alkanivorans]